jgi:formylglycine-generating enzyme required for sulfatase activity
MDPAPAFASAPQAPPSPHTPSALRKVIPKGLRSFDAADADFFLDLLPGPRDRTGLPDSIRFWKTAIEETDPERTCAVGLIYGPSGCGKSSLVKAGLLPRLAEGVCPVYVEATGAETESRLLKGLRRILPELPNNMRLVEVLAELRRGHCLPPGQKVLLVLDQFEQWLHAKRNEENTELVQALRQCDGGRVQAIVMVRDDFWLAVSRFLRELEVHLHEGQNSALVDLFPLRHAEKVLTTFGRAFGALPERAQTLSKEQTEFVTQAIAGLAEEGKVICVRLALFAEMMKDKPWTPAALKDVGGTEGVGVTFLELTFSASTAPPEHRYHQQAARAVLQVLLPESGEDIKGHMRSHAELLEKSGYANRAKEFDELLRILDAELRLITPTDPEGLQIADCRLQIGGKEPIAPLTEPLGFEQSAICNLQSAMFYQLTHDYLVPSLRDWLTRKQKETRRGRAQLCLVERAGLWSSKPEDRHLPTRWEWASIRLLTRRQAWTPAQQKMMRRAGWYHGIRDALLALAVVMLAYFGYEALGHLEARQLRKQLLSAKIQDVPAIVTAMHSYRPWVQPLLQKTLAAPEQQADAAAQLRLRLALSPLDDNQFDPLYEQLFRADPEELAIIRDELYQRRPQQLARQLQQLLQNDKAKPEHRLWAVCALAGCDTRGEAAAKDCWSATDPILVKQLLTTMQNNPSHYKPLVDLLHRVGKDVVKPLTEVYRANQRPDADRLLAANLLTEFAADRPEILADLLLEGTAKQFGILLDKVKGGGEPVHKVWLAELAKPRQASASDSLRVALAQRQASAAVALLRTGHAEQVWPLLKHQPDPTVRSYLIHRFQTHGADPADLARQLDVEPDVTIRRALLLSLGQYPSDALPAEVRDAWLTRVLRIYQDDVDAGMHGASEWLLRQWNRTDWLKQVHVEWAQGKTKREGWWSAVEEQKATLAPRLSPLTAPRWYVNSQGQTMVIIPGPVEFQMGSPATEAGDNPIETLHPQRIGRSFAVGDTAVTVAQFERFLKTHPETRKVFESSSGGDLARHYCPQPDCPQICVSWYMAAEYCNWLSEQEGIPREQWCYEPNTLPGVSVVARAVSNLAASLQTGPLVALPGVMGSGNLSAVYGDGMKLKRDYLHLTGYRLPTEAEWECACRAQTTSRYCFGEPVVLLERYARYYANSNDRGWPVAGQKPNDWGMFDMHGNVCNWCLSRVAYYQIAQNGNHVEDDEDEDDIQGINSQDDRLFRGGFFGSQAWGVRCADRKKWNPPMSRYEHDGFRPARTLRLGSFPPLPPAEGGGRPRTE